MDIVATPPFRAASLLWQPRPGAYIFTVVCKATFRLIPGECVPTVEEEPPNEVDDHWNDDERRSLHVASDLVPFKRHADVVLTGHAYAPQMQPVSSLQVRLAVAGIDKRFEVHADRAWNREGQLVSGAPFLRMPLRWERAAGGPETGNPVGVLADASLDRYGQVALPNLQPAGFLVQWPGQTIPPVGLGPIAPSWPARRAKLHRHAVSWDLHRWAERPLPDDVDAAFFNVAPLDQQVSEIRSDERLLLENLHSEHAQLSTRLPGVYPRVGLTRAGSVEAVRMRCDTLSIDTDRGLCSLVWRGQVALTGPAEAGRVFVTVDHVAREPVSRDDAVMTMVGVSVESSALPFQKEGSPWSAAALALSVIDEGGAAKRGEDDGTGTLFAEVVELGEALPFTGAGQERPAVQSVAREAFSSMIAESAPAAWEAEDEAASLPTVPPPALIGPLATVEMVERGAVPAKIAEAVAPVEEVAPPVAKAEPADLSIERVAEIQAELAEERLPRAEVLHKHDLSEEVWAVTEQHWARAIEEEGRRGGSKLRRASDVAYVAAVERFRGAITGEEYARLMIALERGRAGEELDAMRIQRPALMRIVRVWTKRVAGDLRLGKEVRGVMAGMREG